MKIQIFIATLAAGTAALLPFAVRAQTITYTDNASNYSSSTGYAGQNGGTGFGAFNVTGTGGGYKGTFIGSASESEGGAGTPSPGSIDTDGVSFGTYANTDPTASVTVTRSFTSSLMNTNDAFSLDFVGGYNDGGDVGVSLLDAAGDNVGTFYYSGVTGRYTFSSTATSGPESGDDDLGGFTAGALHLTYTLLSPTSLDLTVSGAINATSAMATISGPITGFEVFQTGASGSAAGAPEFNAYFNNLSETVNSDTTPEPDGLPFLLFSLSGLGAIGFLRRRPRATR